MTVDHIPPPAAAPLWLQKMERWLKQPADADRTRPAIEGDAGDTAAARCDAAEAPPWPRIFPGL